MQRIETRGVCELEQWKVGPTIVWKSQYCARDREQDSHVHESIDGIREMFSGDEAGDESEITIEIDIDDEGE